MKNQSRSDQNHLRPLGRTRPEKPVSVARYEDLITFVQDRPYHDARYAVDAAKIRRDLGWLPLETFESGIRKTVQWYLDNKTRRQNA